MTEYQFTANKQRWKATAPDKKICSIAIIEYFREPTVIMYDGSNEVLYAPDDTAKDQVVACDHRKFLRDYDEVVRACMDTIVPVDGDIDYEQI